MSIQEIQRGGGQGEPISTVLTEDYVEAYKASLRSLGVSEIDVEKCGKYLSEETARAQRAKENRTIEVESLNTNSAQALIDSRVRLGRTMAGGNGLDVKHGGKREEKILLRTKSKVLLLSEESRRCNNQALGGLKNPVETTIKTIGQLSELTSSPLKPAPLAIPVESGIVFKSKRG